MQPLSLGARAHSRWQEGSAVASAMPDRLSRTKGVAEKVKQLGRKVATPVRILTIDELRLRRMKNQPTGPEADLQGIPEPASFFFASAVADKVSRVASRARPSDFPIRGRPYMDKAEARDRIRRRAHLAASLFAFSANVRDLSGGSDWLAGKCPNSGREEDSRMRAEIS